MAVVVTKRLRYAIVGAAVGLLVIALVAISLPAGDDTAADRPASSPEPVASDLPPGELVLFDGSTTSFADFAGTPLVVNFWASWCPACVAELPEFQRVHEERGGDVVFLGIANADLRAPAERLADDVGLTYALVDDPSGELFVKFGLIAMPSTLFVDADGRIVEVFAGQLDASALEERIDRLLEAP